MLCNREIETMTRAEMTKLQTSKLQKTVKWLQEKSTFYQEKLDKLGVRPDELELADLTGLPFTTKEDLAGHYPYGLLTFPLSAVVRMHTTGEAVPVAVAYTSGDIGKWLEMLARSLVAGGLNPTSVLQIAAGYGLSPEGFGLHYAAEVIGATVIPAGDLEPLEQLKQIEDFGVTFLAASAGQLLQLAEAARQAGIDLQALPVSTVYAIRTQVETGLTAQLAELYRADVIEIYGVNELIGPGIAGGCPARNGLHIQEDYFYPEIIDPVTGVLKAEGEFGELVLTSLGKEAMPVLRYRTGQLAALEHAPCSCGRTLVRLRV
jgi:phenylacetate-CoA ligase